MQRLIWLFIVCRWLKIFFHTSQIFLTLLLSEWPKLHRVLAVLSAIGLRRMKGMVGHIWNYEYFPLQGALKAEDGEEDEVAQLENLR